MTDADDPAAASTTPPPPPPTDPEPTAQPGSPPVAVPKPDPGPTRTAALAPTPAERTPTASPDPDPAPAPAPGSGSAPTGVLDPDGQPGADPAPGAGEMPEADAPSISAPEPGIEHGPERPSAAGMEPSSGPEPADGPEPTVRPTPSTAAEPGPQRPFAPAPAPGTDRAAGGGHGGRHPDPDLDEILALVDQIEARASQQPDVDLGRVDAGEPEIGQASAVDSEPEPEPEPDVELDDEPEPEPAAHRLRAADPGDQRRRDVAPAGQVLAVMVATLLLAAGLNSDAMLRSAEASPLGPGRDLAVGFWRPVYEVSSRIGLTGPRDGLDALRRLGSGESDPDDGDGTELVAGLPSAPAGPSADQDTADAGANPGQDEGDGGAATPGTGLLGLDPAGLGSGTADSTANGARSGPLAGEAPQGPPSPVAPTTSSAPAPTPTTQPAPSPTASPPPPDGALRRPTAADPLRILLVGDSTMDAVGAAVLRELEPTGVTRAAVDYKVSSGLARPDFFDWPAHLREARTATRFELVVIMMGANDAQPFMIDGHAENFGTERWLTTYRQRVAALLQQLTADGGGVLWIGQPVMRKETFDADMQQIDRIYAEEVAKVPRARYLDSRAILADGKGAYATHLVDAAGNRQRVRQDDGIHLTEAGAERLAPAVVDAINTLAPLY